LSSDAIGWVFSYSAFDGTTFQVHCALGDSANEQHRYELWSSVEKLARKARCSEASARRALQSLVKDGYLEVLEERRGSTTRYRMLFPAVPIHYDPRGRKGMPVDDEEEESHYATPFSNRGVSSRDPSSGTTRPKGSRHATRTQEEPKQNKTAEFSTGDPDPDCPQCQGGGTIPGRGTGLDELGKMVASVVDRACDCTTRERDTADPTPPPWTLHGMTHREWTDAGSPPPPPMLVSS
jgi:hypothetical protein